MINNFEEELRNFCKVTDLPEYILLDISAGELIL